MVSKYTMGKKNRLTWKSTPPVLTPKKTVSYSEIKEGEPIAYCVRISFSPDKFGFYSTSKELLEAFMERTKAVSNPTYFRCFDLGKEVTLSDFIDLRENSRIIIGALNRRDKKNQNTQSV